MLAARANKALVTKLIAAATTYAFTILLARVMSPDGFGKIAFFLNSALFLSVVGACGQQMAVLRFVPPLVLRDAPGNVSAFATRAFRIAGVGTLAVFFATVGLAFLAQRFGGLPDYSAGVLLLGFALIPLIGWIDLQSHLARGFHLIQLSLFPKDIIWRAVAGLAVLALFFVRDQTPVSARAVLVVLIGTLVSLTLAQFILLRRTTALRNNGRHLPARTMTDWRRATGSFWITSVSNVFLANVDVMLVGIFVGAKAAGFYFAANRLAMLLAFFMTSYNIVLGPMLSEAWHAGRQTEAQTIIHSATLRTALPTTLFGLILVAFSPQILLVFGPDFAQAATPLRILVLAGVLNAFTGPADIALNMCGHDRPAMRASAVSLIVSAALLLAGVWYGGITGVAFAVLLGTAVRKTMFWWLALLHMAIRTDVFAVCGLWSARVEAPGP